MKRLLPDCRGGKPDRLQCASLREMRLRMFCGFSRAAVRYESHPLLEAHGLLPGLVKPKARPEWWIAQPYKEVQAPELRDRPDFQHPIVSEGFQELFAEDRGFPNNSANEPRQAARVLKNPRVSKQNS